MLKSKTAEYFDKQYLRHLPLIKELLLRDSLIQLLEVSLEHIPDVRLTTRDDIRMRKEGHQPDYGYFCCEDCGKRDATVRVRQDIRVLLAAIEIARRPTWAAVKRELGYTKLKAQKKLVAGAMVASRLGLRKED